MSVAPQVNVLILGWNNAGTSAGATGGILKFTPAECRRNHRRYTPHAVRHKHLCPTGGKCPNSWADIAGTSAGATGGKHKPTPAVEAIAPQVDVSTAGKHRPARTEDRR